MEKKPSDEELTILREVQWAEREKGFDTSECRHNFGTWGSKFRVCETGTAYIRYCKLCKVEVERHEK